MINALIRFYTWMPWLAFVLAELAFVAPARIRLRFKILWTAALALCSAKFIVFSSWGGSPYYPELPLAVTLGWTTASLSVAILAVLSLVWWVRRGREIVLPTLAATLAIGGLWSGICTPTVREIDLTFPNLPPSIEGYRIVQISDIHASYCMRRKRTRAFVETANALSPDLICLTGDLVDGPPAKAGDFLEPIKDLRARDGVWAITGNHEYFENLNPHKPWQALYDQWGIRFLANDCIFPKPGLAVAGVNDPQVDRRKDALAEEAFFRRPDVAQAFATATNGEFRVLLDHRPTNARINFERHGVDLQLSGHSHGGSLPLIASLIAKDCDGYVSGLYRFGNRVLYVNNGAGQTAAFPFRFFTPSEITCFTLKRRAD